MMIAGAVFAGLGTLLPWLRFGGVGFGDLPNGFDTYFIGDAFDGATWTNPGIYVLVSMAFVGLFGIILMVTKKSVVRTLLSIGATLLAGLVAVAALGAVGSAIDQFSLDIGPGIGLVVLGSVLSFVGAIVGAVKR